MSISHFHFRPSFCELIWLSSAPAGGSPPAGGSAPPAGGSAPAGVSSKRAGDTPENRDIAELEERDETAAELSKRFSFSGLSTGKKVALAGAAGLGGLYVANQFGLRDSDNS